MAYIYVLHFHEKLSHAMHYIGCTESPRQRLNAHAAGAGSKLTRALVEQGIEWRLGSLMTCSHKRMRELERGLKDEKNSSRYCGVCNASPASFPGTQHYPIENLSWPIESSEMKRAINGQERISVRLTEDNEPQSTIRKILDLQRPDKDALGFIPGGGSGGLATYVHRKRICLAYCNDTLIGYCAYKLNSMETRIAIHQLCVADSARMKGAGRMMVALVLTSWEAKEAVAKVRDDLAANSFWQEIGFRCEKQVPHKTSGRTINHYLYKKQES